MKLPQDDDSLESIDTEEERFIDDDEDVVKEEVNPIIGCFFGAIAYIQYFWYYQRAEFVLGLILITSISLALTGVIESLEAHNRQAPKQHFVMHDYTEINSAFDLKIGSIDHWCFGGGDQSCPKCLDPLEPVPTMNKPWGKAHNNNVKSIQNYMDNYGDIDVVFVGSDLIEARQGLMMGTPSPMLDKIKQNFEKQFSKRHDSEYNGIALGISGDNNAQLLWRLMRGETPSFLDPKVWWISIGEADLVKSQCSEDITLMGILRIVEELESRYPKSTIVVNSLLPYSTAHDTILEGPHVKNKYWPSIKQVNDNLETFASKHKGVKFFNADDIFIRTKYKKKYVKKDLFKDPGHLNEEGQKIWGEQQYAMIDQIIKSMEKTQAKKYYGYEEDDDVVRYMDDYYLDDDNSTFFYDDIF